MPRLLLVRHGQVESDNPARYWGHTDIPLSRGGLKQAERLSYRLAQEDVKAIYCSDLKRAVDTATIIAAPHRVPVVSCPELREINFGECEGLAFADIVRLYPEAERLWAGADPELSFPGGESMKALAQRVDHFGAGLSCHGNSDTVLVVAHGGSLRMLLCQMTGLQLSQWWQLRLDPASLTVIDSRAEGAVPCLLNDISHLQGVNNR